MKEGSKDFVDAMPEAVRAVWLTIDAKIPTGAKAKQYGKLTLCRQDIESEDKFFTVLGGFSEVGGDNRKGYVFYEGGDLARANIAILKGGEKHMTLLSEEGVQKLLTELRSAVA